MASAAGGSVSVSVRWFQRDMIASRRHDAFAAAKAAGKQIGNPSLGPNNRKAAIPRAEAVRLDIIETMYLSTRAQQTC